MILELFIVLLVLSGGLIGVGLFKPTESAQALIGFTLMFILAIVILAGGLEYRNGATITTSGTVSTVSYSYDSYNDSTTHNFGYFLAIAGAAGFIGVLVSLRGNPKT